MCDNLINRLTSDHTSPSLEVIDVVFRGVVRPIWQACLHASWRYRYRPIGLRNEAAACRSRLDPYHHIQFFQLYWPRSAPRWPVTVVLQPRWVDNEHKAVPRVYCGFVYRVETQLNRWVENITTRTFSLSGKSKNLSDRIHWICRKSRTARLAKYTGLWPNATAFTFYGTDRSIAIFPTLSS